MGEDITNLAATMKTPGSAGKQTAMSLNNSVVDIRRRLRWQVRCWFCGCAEGSPGVPVSREKASGEDVRFVRSVCYTRHTACRLAHSTM